MTEFYDKEALIKRYRDRFEKNGYSPETLGWGKRRHYLRYHILLTQWDINQSSVLDFGCGFGDMYDYSKRLNLDVDYHGFDIQPDLINEGKKRFPEADLRLVDIFTDQVDEKFDYIFSSGVHNLKIDDHKGFVETTFDWFADHATKGFAVNFVSNRVDFQQDHLAYTDPAYVLDIAFKYSNRVTLRHDYMPFEFSVFIDKRSEPDSQYNVFPEYVKLI